MFDFVLQFFSTPDQTTFEAASFGRDAFWITQMVLMIVVIVGLVGLTIRILKVNGVGAWIVLVILGFIAGMGALLIKVFAQLDNEQRMRAADLGIGLSHYDSNSVYLKRNPWMQVCAAPPSGTSTSFPRICGRLTRCREMRSERSMKSFSSCLPLAKSLGASGEL